MNGTVYGFAVESRGRPRCWLDSAERRDLAGRLRFLADVLDHADELTDAADLVRDVLSIELRRLS